MGVVEQIAVNGQRRWVSHGRPPSPGPNVVAPAGPGQSPPFGSTICSPGSAYLRSGPPDGGTRTCFTHWCDCCRQQNWTCMGTPKPDDRGAPMARNSYDLEGELESEFEDEFEGELEDEGEEFLGGVARAVDGLLGEEEMEYEDEFESEYEGELEEESEDESESEYEDEAFLGGIARIAGSLLGAGEGEYEDEAEEFFGKIGRAFRTAAPFLGTGQ